MHIEIERPTQTLGRIEQRLEAAWIASAKFDSRPVRKRATGGTIHTMKAPMSRRRYPEKSSGNV
jgi:hypothetical protein